MDDLTHPSPASDDVHIGPIRCVLVYAASFPGTHLIISIKQDPYRAPAFGSVPYFILGKYI